ncbi:MAG: hypothetical protein ACPLKP_02420 [Microgenomates group bacterium]
MEKNNNECHCESFLTGLLLGIIVGGGVLYFLTATNEGKKVKKKLIKKGKEALEELGDLVEEIEENKGELERKAKETQEQIVKKIESLEERKDNLIDKIVKEKRKFSRFFKRNGRPLV